MNKRFAILSSATLFSMMSQVSLAEPLPNMACPSIEQIRAYSPISSFPVGFDQAKQSIQALAIAGNMDELDNDNDNDNEGRWILVMQPVDVQLSATTAQATQNVLEGLTLVSTTPYNYSVVDGLDMQVCAYKLPNQPKLSALAYYITPEIIDDMDDEMDDDYAKLTQKSGTKHKRILAIAKTVKKFAR